MKKPTEVTARVSFRDAEGDRPSLRDDRLRVLLRGKLLEQLCRVDLDQHIEMKLERDGPTVTFTLRPKTALGRQMVALLSESDVNSDLELRIEGDTC